MRPHTETLLDACAACTTVLRRELRCNRQDRNSVYPAIVGDPGDELAPGGIADGLGKVMIFGHVADGKFLVGNHVARQDERACLFPGEVFTLPLHFQMRLSQFLLCLVPVFRLLGTFVLFSVESLESRFGFSQVSGVRNSLSFGVRRVGMQAHINTDLLPSRHMLYLSRRL